MTKVEAAPVYGYCPICGEQGIDRERRIGGDDSCKNNHVYPSSKAMFSSVKDFNFYKDLSLFPNNLTKP
jgi:hypothetical protein